MGEPPKKDKTVLAIVLFAFMVLGLTVVILKATGVINIKSTRTEPSPAVTIPTFKIVDDSPLLPKKGRRIQANVKNPNITQQQCAAIVMKLRYKAMPDGQVSVHIPVTANGAKFAPLCYENVADGQGVQVGIARPPR